MLRAGRPDHHGSSAAGAGRRRPIARRSVPRTAPLGPATLFHVEHSSFGALPPQAAPAGPVGPVQLTPGSWAECMRALVFRVCVEHAIRRTTGRVGPRALPTRCGRQAGFQVEHVSGPVSVHARVGRSGPATGTAADGIELLKFADGSDVAFVSRDVRAPRLTGDRPREPASPRRGTRLRGRSRVTLVSPLSVFHVERRSVRFRRPIGRTSLASRICRAARGPSRLAAAPCGTQAKDREPLSLPSTTAWA